MKIFRNKTKQSINTGLLNLAKKAGVGVRIGSDSCNCVVFSPSTSYEQMCNTLRELAYERDEGRRQSDQVLIDILEDKRQETKEASQSGIGAVAWPVVDGVLQGVIGLIRSGAHWSKND